MTATATRIPHIGWAPPLSSGARLAASKAPAAAPHPASASARVDGDAAPAALIPQARVTIRAPMRRLCLLIAVALVAVSCRLPLQRGRWNVIVVMVDTLRADHLAAYGYTRPTSPNFDALAAQSYLFTDARSQASCTYPSVNSVLTSRYPSRFLGQAEGRFGIPDNVRTIGEILGAQGWSTAAVSASPVVRKNPTRYNPGGGFDRGFGRFDEECLWHPGACVSNRGLATAERLREPFFLYLHYMDPHGPYDPPQPYRKQFRAGRTQERWALRGDVNPLQRFLDGTGPPATYGPAALRFCEGLYDGEIAYFDAQLGRLVDQLRGRRLLDRTILVVLSDHGESFLEHGKLKHCQSVYDSEVKVPFLVRLPRQHRGERIAGPIENLDLVPTLLDLLALPVEGQGFEGRSLMPRLAGKPAGERLAFSMIQRQRSAAGAAYKQLS